MYLLNLTLLGYHRNVRSSKKPKFFVKSGLHHIWEHNWLIGNGNHAPDEQVQRFQDSNERTDKHSTSLGAEDAKSKPYGDFFAKERLVQPC